mgnify:CR=1 FL=1
MVKYTRHWLKKIETLYESGGFAIRYEKGHFQSGHCIVEQKKVVVINKFYDVEARINTLLDLLTQVNLDPATMDESQKEMWLKLGRWQGELSLENDES